MKLLELKNVTKSYCATEEPTLKRVDLVINGGDYVSIKGVSGSGKSTLLYMLGGLLQPTEGKILHKGEEIYLYKDEKLSEWRGKYVGYLFQNIQMLQALTVRENMKLARNFGNNQNADVDEMIEKLGLKEVANKLPGRLSGGQRRRAMIGCVLIRKPQIILADEPTNDLDIAWAEKIIEYLYSQIGEENALVLVTHDPKWADSAPIKWEIENGLLIQKK